MAPIPDSPTYAVYAKLNKNAGIVLMNLRKSRGESQHTLAHAIGYSQDAVSKMERGRKDIGYVAWKAIAAHYHKDLRALLLSIAAPATLWDIAKHELREDKS